MRTFEVWYEDLREESNVIVSRTERDAAVAFVLRTPGYHETRSVFVHPVGGDVSRWKVKKALVAVLDAERE